MLLPSHLYIIPLSVNNEGNPLEGLLFSSSDNSPAQLLSATESFLPDIQEAYYYWYNDAVLQILQDPAEDSDTALQRPLALRL